MKKRARSRSNVTPMFPGDPVAAAAPEKPFGSFRPSGSFYADGPGTDALTRAILGLMPMRAGLTPAEFAQAVRASAALPAFHEESLAQWDTLAVFEDWWQARTKGSAEAFVKYEGCAVDGTWAGGRHVPRAKIQHEPPMPQHVREALNHDLLDAIDRLAGRQAPPAGEQATGISPAAQDASEEYVPALETEG